MIHRVSTSSTPASALQIVEYHPHSLKLSITYCQSWKKALNPLYLQLRFNTNTKKIFNMC